jgi:hypothetical protein
MQVNKHHTHMSLWIGVTLALCCALIGPTSAHAQNLKLFNTGNYTVHTDVPVNHARPFAQHMDKVFDEYKRRFEKLNLSSSRKLPARMDLYLFETQQSYERFLASKGIPAQNTGGMFVVNPKVNGLFTYIKDRPVRQTLSTLQHEGFHQFAFSYIGPDLPIWVNEGIAQFFEDGVLINKRFHLEIANARRLSQIKDAIATNRSLPFSTLITMSDKQWGQNVQQNQSMASMQYDQAWSMVYFLINSNDKLLTAFNQYLIAVGSGVDSQQAFVNSFSLQSSSYAQLTADFETAWKRYISQIEPNAVSQVSDNMNFLAHGLLWIRKSKRPDPKSIEELRSILQKVNYRISRTVNGVQTTFTASDEELFRYDLPNGSTPLLSLSVNNSAKLPPIISAPGLKPAPSLVWYYMDNDLVYDVTYQ